MRYFNLLVAIISLLMLLSINAPAISQTVTDSVLTSTGTVMRGIPYVEPIEPNPLEPNNTLIIPSKRSEPKKTKKQFPEIQNEIGQSVYDTDTLLTNAYRNSLLAYYHSIEKRNIANAATFDSVTSYYSWALKNRQQVIARQQITGSIIFILVSILVISGLIFSAIQFYIALKSVKNKNPIPNTSLKASLSGVEVSSSVLGVIILTISIAFFYLYLSKVYPLVTLDQISIQSSE